MFGMRTGVASSLWPPERVPRRLSARDALPERSAQPNIEGLATACPVAPRRLPLPGDLARGKLYDQAERAISNG